MLHSINEVTTGDLLAELMTRGVDVSSAVNQMKAERQTSDKVIRYPTQPERLYGIAINSTKKGGVKDG